MQKKAKLLAYLDALGLNGRLNSFSDRIRIQKLVYLLKQYDTDLQFGYNWYVHGPYSPQLTRTLFDPASDASREQLGKTEMEYLNDVRNFLKEDMYSPDALELIVSLIYVAKNGETSGLGTKKAITEFILNEKPQFARAQVDEAWDRIASSPRFGKLLPR